GSEGVQKAIDEGIALANLTGAAVHGLYVVDDRAYVTMPDADLFGVTEALEAEGERAVTEVAERAAAGVESETVVEHGSPATEIVAYADRVDADLITVGAHGRSGVERLLLGSVTENVVRRTDQPVHVVRVEDGDGER
ncbi:universal stress protein, partial [Halobacteriales archaeon QH_6_64_20]